jgi:hypothetical protein
MHVARISLNIENYVLIYKWQFAIFTKIDKYLHKFTIDGKQEAEFLIKDQAILM